MKQKQEWYEPLIFKNEQVARAWVPKLKEWRKQFLGSKVVQVVDKFEVLDFDKLFEESRARGAMLLPCGAENDSVAMGGSVDDIIERLFMSSDGGINFVASCNCGHLKGNPNIGLTCPICKSQVHTLFADEIAIHAWLEIPEPFPPFLQPAVYRILDKWIGAAKRKVSILDSILNIDADIPPPLNLMFTRGGMTFFYKNFWDIINFIASKHKGQKAAGDADIFRFLETYKDRLFTRHIPILDQSLHVITKNGSMRYNDTSSGHILQTCLEVHDMIQQYNHHPAQSETVREQRTFAAFKSWMNYTDSIIKDKIQGKKGFARKNILGARVHASGRGVIVPITKPHMADELELPWKMAVGMYRLEILNLLHRKFGLNYPTAIAYWTQSLIPPSEDEKDERVKQEVMNMTHMVQMCLQDLIDQCPYKGLPVTMGRNPTLRLGAVQLFFSSVKNNIYDDTVGMSPFSLSAPNADFDGDALYLSSIKEMGSVIDFLKIHPAMTLLGGTGEALSSTVHMSDEMAIASHSYFTDDDTLDLDKYWKALHPEVAA